MRIAIWIERFFPDVGGLEKSMMNLSLRLLNLGFEVDVITRYNTRINGIRILDLGNDKFLEKSFQYLTSNADKYDVLYLSRIFQDKEQEHLKYIKLLPRFKFILLRIPTTNNVNLINSLDIDNILKEKIDFLISQNYESLIQCRKLFPKQHTILSRNFTDPPNNFNIQHNRVFLFAGRITESKNLYRLLKAWEIVNKRHKQQFNSIKLNIYGIAYERNYFNMCKKTIEKIENVEFCGQYEPFDLSIIDKSYFVIIPSLKEGHSNFLLESLSCGTPAITSKIPGLVEDMASMENFLINDPTNITEIADKITMAINISTEDYEKISKDIRSRSIQINKIKPEQIELFNFIDICSSYDFSVLIVKPEAIGKKHQIFSFLEKNEFEIISNGNKNDWDTFVKTFYTDFSITQFNEYIKAYNTYKFNLRYYFLIVRHKAGNTLNQLLQLKGEYFSNIKDIDKHSLRAKFGKSSKYNIVSEEKIIVFNGFHCPKTKTELIHTLLFINSDTFLSTLRCNLLNHQDL